LIEATPRRAHVEVPSDATVPAVSVRRVSRLFAGQAALAGVDLEVGGGEVVLVVGPNGAGKSTLLRVLATALVPTFGGGSVLGHDLVAGRRHIRARVEFLGHRTRLYDDLTPGEYLRFVDRLDGAGRGDAAVAAALARTGLAELRDERIRRFSQGTRQRVALARARLRRPDLLLLDEPYAGLDASAQDAVDDLVREATRERRTVLLATHDTDRGEALARRRIRIDAGRIVEDVRS